MFNAESCSVSYSVAKLAIVMLLRPRCQHMFLQMHSMNDPNQSYTVVPNSIAADPFPP